MSVPGLVQGKEIARLTVKPLHRLIAAGRNPEVRYVRQREKRLGKITACFRIGGPHDKFVLERSGLAVEPVGKVGDGETVLGNQLAQPGLVAELVAMEREMTMDERLRRKPIFHGAQYRKQSQG
jgi:hypothetical protein